MSIDRRFLVLAVLMLAASSGGALSQPAPEVRFSAAQCRAEGGEPRDCPTGRSYCRVAYPDAGRPCTDGSQCRGGRCDYARRAPPPEGQTARGLCIAASDPCTCQAEVEEGRVIGLLCLEPDRQAAP